MGYHLLSFISIDAQNVHNKTVTGIYATKAARHAPHQRFCNQRGGTPPTCHMAQRPCTSLPPIVCRTQPSRGSARSLTPPNSTERTAPHPTNRQQVTQGGTTLLAKRVVTVDGEAYHISGNRVLRPSQLYTFRTANQNFPQEGMNTAPPVGREQAPSPASDCEHETLRNRVPFKRRAC